mgnify:CR=1 FL=1
MISSYGTRFTSLSLLQSELYIVSSASDGSVVMWDVKTGEAKEELLEHSEEVRSTLEINSLLSVMSGTRVSLWKDTLPKLEPRERGSLSLLSAEYSPGRITVSRTRSSEYNDTCCSFN